MANSDSSSSDDERKRKHSKKDKKDKREKRDKKEKEKKHKKQKKDRPDGNGVEVAIGDQISDADYFQKAPEFQLWLQEARSTFLDEISSDEARRLFRKFVDKWNAGQLPAKLYAGVKNSAQSSNVERLLGAKLAACLGRNADSLIRLLEVACAKGQSAAFLRLLLIRGK